MMLARFSRRERFVPKKKAKMPLREIPLILAIVAATLAVAAPPVADGRPPAADRAAVGDRAPIRSPATGGHARGTVILIHGGGWVGHGERFKRRQHHRHAARLNALGFKTAAITYRPGMHALDDVVAFHDALRRRLGGAATLCAMGDSAGGHLALMLAARRPGLDCAISRGAPTDLRLAHGIWLPAVRDRLAPYVPLEEISPVTYADRFAGRVLASQALHDPVVDHDQLARLRRAARGGIATVSLPPGVASYVHARVDAAALSRLERAEARLLVRAAAHRAGR